MRLLELFSGPQSVSKAAKSLGWETVSLDIDSRHTPHLRMDILHFDQTKSSRTVDLVWASCPCEAHSAARTVAIVPRDEAMATSEKLVEKTRQIINYFGCAWSIENPALSRMWKREVADSLLAKSVVTSYCSFGLLHRKNTKFISSFPLILSIC